MSLKLISFVFCINLYFTNAVHLSEFVNNLYIKGAPQPMPTPGPLAVDCFESIISEITDCRLNAIKDWNITKDSPLKDDCCAQWEVIDCDLSAAKSKCSSDDLDEVDKYAQDLIDYFDTTYCQQYPKSSAHCILPLLSKLSDNIDTRPPLPSPLTIDCLGNIKPVVKIDCYKTALRRWNVTRRAPLRNKCCAVWDDIDCLDVIAKIRCRPSEFSATDDYFKQVESWIEKVACSQTPYHSQNCSNALAVDLSPKLSPYIPLPIPSDKLNPNSVNKDYVYFVLNYIMSAFPHLLHLMILLAIILVTIVVIQCFIIVRQLKQERVLAELTPKIQECNSEDCQKLMA